MTDRAIGQGTDQGTDRRTDRARSGVVLALAVLQILSSPLTALVTGGGPATGQISNANSSPVTPAGYAFSIWGLIYLASLAYAIYQVLPGQRIRPVHRRTGWWLAAAFAAATSWVPIFATETIWLSQLVILALVGVLATALIRATTSGPATGRAEQVLLRLPITLYLGWALLAATAGFGTTFRSLGMPERAGWVTLVSIVLVLVATLVSVIVVGRGSALAGFAFTACWALVAVAVASSSAVVSVVAVLAVLVVAATLILRTAHSRQKGVVLLG